MTLPADTTTSNGSVLPRGQVEIGEVADEPARPGLVLLGCLDEQRVDVDTDHVVTGRDQIPAQPAGVAAGIEDAGTAGAIASQGEPHRPTESPSARLERSAASPMLPHPHRRRAQLEHRQRMFWLHAIRITDDDHCLRRNRTHLRVADVLVIDVQDLHLFEVGVERLGVRGVLLERLFNGCTGECFGA
jgi:hypothetical protein